MSVCQMIIFESLDVGSSYLHMRYISTVYDSSSYTKVIGSRSRSQEAKRSKILPQCKISIGNNFRSIKHRDVMFVCSVGFLVRRIESHNRQLCHVTASEHVYLTARMRGWPCVMPSSHRRHRQTRVSCLVLSASVL